MNEEIILDKITVLEERLSAVEEVLHSQNDYIKKLEDTIYNEIINPAADAIREYDHYQGVEGFRGRHPELADLNDKVRAVEGDDFDLATQIYDDYSALEEPVDENEYVGAVIESVNEQIDAIREKLGLPEDATVEIKSDEAGDVEVKADGEDVTEEVKEEVIEEEPKEEEVEEEDKSDEEDLKELYNQLGLEY